MKTFVIAEIGSAWRFGKNHLGKAVEAVSCAKWAGADAVKFQFTSDPRLMEQRRNVPVGSCDILTWPEEWLAAIKQQCDAQGVEFVCTVFLKEDVAKLNPYINRWKVASLESSDGGLKTEMLSTGKEMIVSRGASSSLFESSKWKTLHCTAAYPTPSSELNLKAIRYVDGYSDHSCDVLTGALAVACGASIVEVHFKLASTPSDNPDFKHSHWPDTLRHYIDNIRKAELMLGDGVKKVEACEEWALQHKVEA